MYFGAFMMKIKKRPITQIFTKAFQPHRANTRKSPRKYWPL